MAKTMIAIPCYNAEQYLARSLDSCIAQTERPDIAVLDNCSTDSSYDIARAYELEHSGVRVIRNSENLGRVGNWNACLDEFDKSDAESITLLFTGDELLPGCVSAAERAFASDSSIGVVVWPYEFVRSDGATEVARLHESGRVLSEHEALVENIKEGSVLGALVGNAYSKKAVRSFRFTEAAIGKAEFDINVCHGFKVAFLDKVLARFQVESHRTFDKSLVSQTLPYEIALAAASALEQYRDEMTDEEYSEIARHIALRTLQRQVDVNGPRLEAAVSAMLVTGFAGHALNLGRTVMGRLR